jgi:hypothetical protein
MGLVRSQMQAGQYRRALAFAAHTAGAHLETPAASALYAWLLRIGGQEAYALRVLDTAAQRAPGDAVLAAAQRVFAATPLLASGVLLERPHRMAPFALPYAGPAPIGSSARVHASAVLLGDGRFALVPSAGLTGARRLWVRDGMGRSSAAQLDRTLADSGLALLVLERVLPPTAPLVIAPRDPFAGSPGFVVDFAPSADGAPQWPTLHAGFFAGGSSGATRPLGIATSAGSAGAAVFDAAGRWAGITLPNAAGDSQRAVWLPMSHLRGQLGDLLPAPPASDTAAPVRVGVDEAYERSLAIVLQVLVER